MKRPVSILAAMFQGGGNIPLLTPVLARLVERGHELRIIVGPGVRRSRLPVSDGLVNRLASIGATLVPFRQPEPHPLDNAPPMRGLIGGWVPKPFRNIPGQAQTLVWAPAWAENVATELRRTPTDIVYRTSFCSAHWRPLRRLAFIALRSCIQSAYGRL